MRGLKHIAFAQKLNPGESHLLQMRGLKLIRIVIMVDQLKSHLLQMRGLKPRPSMDSHRQNQVASFTDAWIETCAAMAPFGVYVASFTDAWIETLPSKGIQ